MSWEARSRQLKSSRSQPILDVERLDDSKSDATMNWNLTNQPVVTSRHVLVTIVSILEVGGFLVRPLATPFKADLLLGMLNARHRVPCEVMR